MQQQVDLYYFINLSRFAFQFGVTNQPIDAIYLVHNICFLLLLPKAKVRKDFLEKKIYENILWYLSMSVKVIKRI